MTRARKPFSHSRSALACAAALLGGCNAGSGAGADTDYAERVDSLGVEVPTCSQAGASLYDKTTQALTLQLTSSAPTLIFAVIGGYVTANGYPCVKKTADGGAQLTPNQVKKVIIWGTSADNEKVVVDLQSGGLGSNILSAAGGILVDLVSGAGDEFSLRGTTGADRFSAGQAGGDTYFEISGDTVADVRVQNADTLTISLGAGNDSFSGRGGAFAASHLAAAALTSLAAASAPLTVYGGDGDDVLNGGDGDDALNGGLGNDTFKTHSSADGADVYRGDAGTDKLDYSGRTTALSVVMDGAFASGEGVSALLGPAAEADTVGADVEDLVGGSGNDALQGNLLANRLFGGNGNDWISGGPAGDCTVDIDVLDGGANDDVFAQGSVSDCGDTMSGGSGTDRVDYQLRSANLFISLDGGANDGAAGEQDNVKTDIEIAIGGAGADTLSGSPNADELHGGPQDDVISGAGGDDVLIGDSGNDTLNGEGGNDTFLESGLDAEYASGTEQRGLGSDTINGGTISNGGLDTADYSQRSASLGITLCTDIAKTKGPSGLSAAPCSDDDGDASLGEADSLINVQHLIGGTAGDTLAGHTGNELLEGGAGADSLHGGAGNDTLYGDLGADSLYGDAGDDYLDGVGGVDTVIDGDNGANSGDGDICIADSGETPTNCEL